MRQWWYWKSRKARIQKVTNMTEYKKLVTGSQLPTTKPITSPTQ